MRLTKILSLSLLGILLFCGETGAEELRRIPPGSRNIQYFGRWDRGPEISRCAAGAACIKAVFTGTSLRADLTDTGIWWRVSIDGQSFKPLQSRGADTLLAEGLSPGSHTVLLVRSTEGEAGISEFRGFILDRHATLLKPEPMKARRLEFVGDSITAGAMNLGRYTGENYYDLEDNDMAYGPQLARMLDADYSVIGNSGQGVSHNYAEEFPYDGIHAADSYLWTFPVKQNSDDTTPWDPTLFPVDAVIISIGTNDFIDRENLTAADFKEGCRRLTAAARELNPGKPIIWVEPLPSWLGSDARSWIRETLDEMEAEGDSRLYFIPVNEEKPLLTADCYADGETHPTQKGSAILAEYLKDKIAAILGWQ